MIEDQNEVEVPSLLVDATGTPLTPEPTLDEKLAEVRAKLGLNNDEQPISTDNPDTFEVTEGNPGPSGADVDWSNFDLDPKFAHLYRLPSTQLRVGPDGPTWIAIVDDFRILRAPYDVLGRMIAQAVNGPEGWRLQSAAVPAGAITKKQALLIGGRGFPTGPAGVVTLQRKVPIILPTPALLKSEAEDAATVPAPKEEELQQAEDAALAWIESDAGRAAPVNDADTPTVTPEALEDRGPAEDRTAEGARKAANDALNA